ncbi:MAG: maltooligosyltrehalose trehalohydrolase, partial [Gammaproteobacteria bacterium]|nr:maltooligosyltrehalose trehalohydrolase [Gammaproteobacteria bacterium]
MILKVWAPAAKSVELVTGVERRGLQPLPQGDWQIDVPEAALADGYKYSIDGGMPVPDPRSAWQPQGVHGASYALPGLRSPGVFEVKGLEQAVIYELHVGTFTPAGTYVAAREKLAHLSSLGVT